MYSVYMAYSTLHTVFDYTCTMYMYMYMYNYGEEYIIHTCTLYILLSSVPLAMGFLSSVVIGSSSPMCSPGKTTGPLVDTSLRKSAPSMSPIVCVCVHYIHVYAHVQRTCTT